jgi:glutamyl-Q tRNA(Asp) synthetase
MYRGRFAPSPTGPLHLGSLVAAAASYLDARAHGGEWLVRMEDVDEPRCSSQHAATILRQLEAYGFAWQGEVVYQSQRKSAYRAALDELQRRGAVFGCACTRSELGQREFYPGTCRNGVAAGRTARAWRLRVDEVPIEFTDRARGAFTERLTESIGDVVLLRADGFFAYQLAVVVDDGWQGITHVVRGEDLLSSTARQIFLQRQLALLQPRYLHVDVVTDAQGHKLSKQTKAGPLPLNDVERTLAQAFAHLGLAVPTTAVAEMWRTATSQWLYTPGGTGTGGGLNA